MDPRLYSQDVLVVTAPNSGAEIIPFLKTYVNLPSAIAFTVMYSSMCNRMSTEKVITEMILLDYSVTECFVLTTN
jgi:ATP:ADP antiporter, AAA family